MKAREQGETRSGLTRDWIGILREERPESESPPSPDPAQFAEGIYYLKGDYYRPDDRGHYQKYSKNDISAYICEKGVPGEDSKEMGAFVREVFSHIQNAHT